MLGVVDEGCNIVVNLIVRAHDRRNTQPDRITFTIFSAVPYRTLPEAVQGKHAAKFVVGSFIVLVEPKNR